MYKVVMFWYDFAGGWGVKDDANRWCARSSNVVLTTEFLSSHCNLLRHIELQKVSRKYSVNPSIVARYEASVFL